MPEEDDSTNPLSATCQVAGPELVFISANAFAGRRAGFMRILPGQKIVYMQLG